MEGGALPGRVRLGFASPTAFDSGKGNILFPEPSLVFRSLWEKWNAHAPWEIGGDILTELVGAARVEAHRLHTQPVKLKLDGKLRFFKGFVGWCEFSTGPKASPEVQRVLHLLADFAFYAGVGSKTTMGMGQAAALSLTAGMAPSRLVARRQMASKDMPSTRPAPETRY
jgi:CRISPR-associated endoribonuclease Cas6